MDIDNWIYIISTLIITVFAAMIPKVWDWVGYKRKVQQTGKSLIANLSNCNETLLKQISGLERELKYLRKYPYNKDFYLQRHIPFNERYFNSIEMEVLYDYIKKNLKVGGESEINSVDRFIKVQTRIEGDIDQAMAEFKRNKKLYTEEFNKIYYEYQFEFQKNVGKRLTSTWEEVVKSFYVVIDAKTGKLNPFELEVSYFNKVSNLVYNTNIYDECLYFSFLNCHNNLVQTIFEIRSVYDSFINGIDILIQQEVYQLLFLKELLEKFKHPLIIKNGEVSGTI